MFIQVRKNLRSKSNAFAFFFAGVEKGGGNVVSVRAFWLSHRKHYKKDKKVTIFTFGVWKNGDHNSVAYCGT